MRIEMNSHTSSFYHFGFVIWNSIKSFTFVRSPRTIKPTWTIWWFKFQTRSVVIRLLKTDSSYRWWDDLHILQSTGINHDAPSTPVLSLDAARETFVLKVWAPQSARESLQILCYRREELAAEAWTRQKAAGNFLFESYLFEKIYLFEKTAMEKDDISTSTAGNVMKLCF